MSSDADLGPFASVTFDAITVSPDPLNLVVGGSSGQVSIAGAFSGDRTVASLPINNTTTSFSFSPNNGVANFSATGVFHGLDAGNTTVTASYTLANVTRTDTFVVRVFEFEANAESNTVVPGGNYTDGYSLMLTRADGTTQSSFASGVSYSMNPAVNGLTINSTTGVVTNNGSVTSGTFNVVVTVNDAVSGLTFTDTVPFTFAAPI